MTGPAYRLPSTEAPLTPLVVVLMSTYNGERYVVEQLTSILQQLPPGGSIIVRDDGSRDATAAFAEAVGDSRVAVIRGTNLGFGASFLTLLTMVSADADLVMFSDQDDVWLPGKIDRAWRYLQPLGTLPALYGSGKCLVDEALRPLGVTPPWPQPPSFQNALVENIITGCTAAINKQALALLKIAGVPHGIYFHDWWLYLVVGAHGQVVLDPEPTLLYRQHGNNQIGQGASFAARQAGMVQFLWRRDWAGILLTQIAVLMVHYGRSLSDAQRALVLGHFDVNPVAPKARWRLLLGLQHWRQYPLHEPALRLLLLAHRARLWPLATRRLVR